MNGALSIIKDMQQAKLDVCTEIQDYVMEIFKPESCYVTIGIFDLDYEIEFDIDIQYEQYDFGIRLWWSYEDGFDVKDYGYTDRKWKMLSLDGFQEDILKLEERLNKDN